MRQWRKIQQEYYAYSQMQVTKREKKMIDHNYVVLRKIGNTTQETLSFLWSFSSDSALWYLILFHIIMIIISTSVLTLSYASAVGVNANKTIISISPAEKWATIIIQSRK